MNEFSTLVGRQIRDPAQLAFREEPIRILRERVRNRQNTVLLGVEGVGKSSLLSSALDYDFCSRAVREDRLLICSVDLSAQKDGDSMLRYLCGRLDGRSRSLLREVPGWEGLKETLQSIKQDAALEPRASLENMVEAIDDFCGCQVALVQDGFENFVFSSMVGQEHHELFRSLIQAGKLTCVVATDYDLSRDSLPPDVQGSLYLQLFDVNTELPLRGFTREETVRYIREKQSGGETLIGDEDAALLHSLTGGIPALLNAAAGRLWDLREKEGVQPKQMSQVAVQLKRSEAGELLRSWCRLLTEEQVSLLEKLAGDKDSPDKPYVYLGEGSSALKQLTARGLLVTAADEPEGRELVPQAELRNLSDLYRVNSTLLRFYILDGQARSASEEKPTRMKTPKAGPAGTVMDLLRALIPGGDGRSPAEGFLRYLFDRESILSAPQLPPSEERSPEEEADALSAGLFGDEPLNIQAEDLQTLDELFGNARNRRSGLTDELLDSLSDDCRFYIKSAVVVEDRLSSLKFTDADFTPQMILYGKAMEQCLKDELYDLFHAEPTLSSFNVRGFTGAMETFGNRGRDRIQISGFAALIKAQASHLASLCSGASDAELRRCSARWWTDLSEDVLTANSVRNKVHPGKGNAVETDVNRLVDALIGSEEKEGILSRLEAGRQLYRLMYTNPIPLNARQTYCNTQQELRVVQVKPGQKLRIRAVLRAPGNREYTVKLRMDKETGKGLVPGSRLQAALGEALSQDGEEFFHGEVVSILS